MAEKTKIAKPHTSRRETFNQIVLMLIVAFTLRVFVVEAFVIPTGSMAPTLKGAHSRFACDNCGYGYDVNFSPERSSPTEINIPRRSVNQTAVYCPNCGYRAPDADAERPLIYYGDRILVLKYAYLLQNPKRWDVVVFKTPASPEIHHYGQAYIKRLVGTPGERIMILDGDIYAAGASDPSPADWHIQRKPDVVQDALWRIVHDIDYAPLGLTPANRIAYEKYGVESYLPWKTADSNWLYTRDATGARAFHYRDLEGAGTLRFDRSIGREKAPLSDFLAYDQLPGQGKTNPVSDVKLSLFYLRGGGSGPLELKLSKRNDLFIAQISPDAVSLFRARMDAPDERTLISRRPYVFGDRPVKIDFMNLDYCVRLLVEGSEIIATTPQEYSPDLSALQTEVMMPPYPTISVTAEKQVCEITHLSLWRDVFYTSRNRYGQPLPRGGWENPVQLGPDEYFTLGDNSPLSEDGRFWQAPVDLPAEDIHAQAGVVPGRFMLGKAMLVYWPAGFRLYYPSAPDLIPNFGEMRFIH